MHIAWTAFGQVVVVSFGVAVTLTVLFAIGVALLSSPARAPAPHQDRPHLAPADRAGAPARATPARGRVPLGRLVPAWGCFVACALCVAYGLYVIVAR